MARAIQRRILLLIDVRRDYSIQVSPTNHESERHAPLVDAFCIIRNPGDCIRYTRVNAEGLSRD